MKTNHFSQDQSRFTMWNKLELHYELLAVCRELESGRHGSFAQAIARAYAVADKGNGQKLFEAFPDLFERGHHFVQSRRLQQA